MIFRGWWLAAVCAGAFLAACPSAHAADSLAPAGSPPTWLPDQPWVRNRWLPYNESDLFRILKVDIYSLGRWVTDHRGLDGLVRARGLKQAAVERELLKPWQGRVTGAQYRTLLRRTELTFSQHHLAVHMFFHTFHLNAVNGALPGLLKVSFQEMGVLEGRGLSLMDIAVRHGRKPDYVLGRLKQLMRASALEGVRLRAVLPTQARAWLSYEDYTLSGWISWKPQPASAASVTAAFARAGVSASAPAGAHLFCSL